MASVKVGQIWKANTKEYFLVIGFRYSHSADIYLIGPPRYSGETEFCDPVGEIVEKWKLISDV